MSKPTADEFVACAEYFIGYLEKASEAYCDSPAVEYFDKNAGSNNYTYFGKICGINPGAWCAMFVTVCMLRACGGDKAAAKEMLYGVYPYAACNQLYDAAGTRAFKRGYKDPARGDVIVFTSGGQRSHTGIVYKVDNTYVYTVEGNSSNQVRRRSYKLSDSYIYGYVRLDFSGDAGSGSESLLPHYDRRCTATMPELSKGTAGTAVAMLQYGLNQLGTYLIDVDGIFGSETKKAVESYQGLNNLSVDGVVGSNTWKKIFEN